ncbi:hypothetical protein V6N12_062809 [Hibiscus sabdariffa]|uniref:FRIGIDA-like protein n=1 Tax=Hibiscus sabdariffa TaxID=183260 RepID=A0ABR2F9Z0_9ROSI
MSSFELGVDNSIASIGEVCLFEVFDRLVSMIPFLEAFRIINGSSKVLAGSALVDSIRSLISQDWNTKIRHVCRELNSIEDRLAVLAKGLPVGEVLPLSSAS